MKKGFEKKNLACDLFGAFFRVVTDKDTPTVPGNVSDLSRYKRIRKYFL